MAKQNAQYKTILLIILFIVMGKTISIGQEVIEVEPKNKNDFLLVFTKKTTLKIKTLRQGKKVFYYTDIEKKWRRGRIESFTDSTVVISGKEIHLQNFKKIYANPIILPILKGIAATVGTIVIIVTVVLSSSGEWGMDVAPALIITGISAIPFLFKNKNFNVKKWHFEISNEIP